MHPAMMFKEMKLLIQTQIRICLQSPICASSKFTSPTAEHCDNHSRANKQSKEKKKSKTANTKQLAELIVAYRMSQSPDTKAVYRASMTSYDIGQPVLDLL